MGRRLNEESREILSYFTLNRSINRSICRLCATGETEISIPGCHTGNLNKHLKRKHPQVYEDLVEKLNEMKAKKPTVGQTVVKDYFAPDPKAENGIRINISAAQLKDICVELVTLNGLPLCALEYSGFKKLLDPISKSLNMCVNRENIRLAINEKADNFRKLIREEVKGKFLSIKIDSATRLDRSLLGVNVQFVHEARVVVRTLGVYELTQRHNAEYIRDVLYKVLDDYGISISQIYTMTTDNGRNMVKTSALLRTDQNEFCEEQQGASDDELEVNEDNDIEIYHEEDLINITLSEKSKNNPILTSVKCMAHTLQLAINDVLSKTSCYKSIIEMVLSVVIKLRTPSILSLLKERSLKKPIRNVVTRWNSTYLMMKRLLELQTFCENMEGLIPDLHISPRDWKKVENICEVLLFPYNATVRLQQEQLLLSEAYAIWFRCKLQLSGINNSYSKPLLEAMELREKFIISQCGPILSAVFLDPRYRNLLSENDIETAKEHLKNLCKYVFREVSHVENDSSTVDESETDDILQKFILKRNTTISTDHTNFEYIFSFIQNLPLLPQSSNILEFWNKVKNTHISNIAKIVLGVPATQVTVERVFSTLKWILSERRNNLDSGLLENILIIISNNKFDTALQ